MGSPHTVVPTDRRGHDPRAELGAERPRAGLFPVQPLEKAAAAVSASPTCWICGSTSLTLMRERTVPARPTPEMFRVTDASYGQTFTIHRCERCGFLQCMDAEDVIPQYEEMSDGLYVATSEARTRQMQSLLRTVGKFKQKGRFLDVGAGIGLLVEEARKLGFDAEGVEPSRALQAAAAANNLPVHLGVIPSPEIAGPYDIVSAIDVIEHVDKPLDMLAAIRDLLAPDGIGVLVTPDVGSITARVMRRKWWHFRPAHIGYFDRHTIGLSLERAGLAPVSIERPTWYLPMDYLVSRVTSYLPGGNRIGVPKVLGRIKVPINLHDSLLVVFRRSDTRRPA
jgi:SAM-dependent methyltransferase